MCTESISPDVIMKAAEVLIGVGVPTPIGMEAVDPLELERVTVRRLTTRRSVS